MFTHCYDAHVLWFLGFAETADTAIGKALTLVKKLGSPFNEANCYILSSMYYAHRLDVPKTLETAEAALDISTKGGFLHWVACGRFLKGWALCRTGNLKEGIPLALDGIEKYKSTGAQMNLPACLGLVAEAQQRAGTLTEAFAAVEEGLRISARNNDRHYDAELWRRKGELLEIRSKRGSSGNEREEAEKCFRTAIRIAQRQRAKSLELRATMSLSRLWMRQGKLKQAHAALKKIYGWFSEGFDTPDLKQAKALLEGIPEKSKTSGYPLSRV